MVKSFGRINRLFMFMILLLGTILAGCNSDSDIFLWNIYFGWRINAN